jgi:hypothetical protein
MQFLLRSLVRPAFQPGASQDRKLQALRHREGMGENWRSYRRGYGRRFVISASPDASSARLSTRSARL